MLLVCMYVDCYLEYLPSSSVTVVEEKEKLGWGMVLVRCKQFELRADVVGTKM